MANFCQQKPFPVVTFSLHILRSSDFLGMRRFGVWYKSTKISEESAAFIFRIVIIIRATNITVTQRLTEPCS